MLAGAAPTDSRDSAPVHSPEPPAPGLLPGWAASQAGSPDNASGHGILQVQGRAQGDHPLAHAQACGPACSWGCERSRKKPVGIADAERQNRSRGDGWMHSKHAVTTYSQRALTPAAAATHPAWRSAAACPTRLAALQCRGAGAKNTGSRTAAQHMGCSKQLQRVESQGSTATVCASQAARRVMTSSC